MSGISQSEMDELQSSLKSKLQTLLKDQPPLTSGLLDKIKASALSVLRVEVLKTKPQVEIDKDLARIDEQGVLHVTFTAPIQVNTTRGLDDECF